MNIVLICAQRKKNNTTPLKVIWAFAGEEGEGEVMEVGLGSGCGGS